METNISNKRNIVKNPNWQETDQLAILQSVTEDLNSGLARNKSACDRVEALNNIIIVMFRFHSL